MSSPHGSNMIRVYRWKQAWLARIGDDDDPDLIIVPGVSAFHALLGLVAELHQRGYRFDPQWIPPHYREPEPTMFPYDSCLAAVAPSSN